MTKIRIIIPLLALLLLTPLYGISCEGKSRNATETLPPERPQIDITPPTINISSISGTNPPAKEINIWANIDWSITIDKPFLTVSPTSGMAYQENLVTITVNASGLSDGSYGATININDEKANLLQSVPVRLEITIAEVGQVLDIRVEPSSGTSLTRGILLDHTIVKIGSLDRSGFILQNREHYYVGDRCLLVLGDMRNDTDEDLYVDLWAEGFDSRERQVAWSISSGTIIGHVQYYIPHQSSGSFEITLNWAEDAQLIKIIAHSYDRMIPSPPESIKDNSDKTVNPVNRGAVWSAVERTLGSYDESNPVKDDLIKRGLVKLEGSGYIRVQEIEELVREKVYVIDEQGYLQFVT